MYPSGIELIVDEPSPGHFYWLLQKQSEATGHPVVVDYAAGPMPTHSAAMMEGIVALQRRSDGRQPRRGPQAASTGHFRSKTGGPKTRMLSIQ